MMGDGVIDIGTICEEIEGTGYRGFYEIELPESLAQPKDPASVVARCVKRYLSHT
jgi:hypothetical protein